MQRLEVSGAVRPIYGSLGFKRLRRADVNTVAVERTSIRASFVRRIILPSVACIGIPHFFPHYYIKALFSYKRY
jgi:hypothetical protein